MANSTLKRLILPFSPVNNKEPLRDEVELASVYSIAEFERSKGKGLIVKQPNEKIHFITQIALPLWLYPKNETTYAFDALTPFNNAKISVSQLASAKAFLESLDKQSKTLLDYTTFLSDYQKYFWQPIKEQQVELKGLIAELEFKKELALIRREASENTQPNIQLLTPKLSESEVAATLEQLNVIYNTFKEDIDMLSECLRQIDKLTSQFITELDFAAQAIKDETAAKIKAQEELINPQITKLNSEYKRKIAVITKSYDQEIESLNKQKSKIKNSVGKNEEKIREYQQEAKKQAKQNHLVYEKRWKANAEKAKKEIEGSRKQLSKLDNNISNLSRQKNDELNRLSAKQEAEVNAAKQPIKDLQAASDTKTVVLKQQSDQLIKLEKIAVEMLYGAIKERERGKLRFEELGFKDPLRNPVLLYVPAYAICYQAGLSLRYLFVPPSQTSQENFSLKLKGLFGLSKIQEIIAPRYKAITSLVEQCHTFVTQDYTLESEIKLYGEKNDLLSKASVFDSVTKGLVYLQHEGKLSEKDYETLSISIKNFNK